MNQATIIAAVHEALSLASAPICYVHGDPDDPAFALVVESGHWKKIMEMIPEGDEITNLAMNHGHVGDGDDEGGAAENDVVVPFDRESVRRYLDDGIRHWRGIRALPASDPLVDMAPYYVDAFQSVRISLFGEPLPEEN